MKDTNESSHQTGRPESNKSVGTSRSFDSHTNFDHDYGLPKSSKSEEQSVRKQFDLLGSPLREFIDPISSSSSESDWVMRCVCTNEEEHGDMICCDSCNAWQHISCLGLNPDHLPAKHFCHHCFLESQKISSQENNKNDPINPDNVPLNDPYFHFPLSKPSIPLENFSITTSPSSQQSSKNTQQATDNVEVNQNETESCDCVKKIFNMIASEVNTHSNIYDSHARNKNCLSFTLKNGQKILKASKSIEKDKFVCEIKGGLHIFDDCLVMKHNYNCFSSFIYTLQLTSQTILSVDARTSTHLSRYIRRSCTPNTSITYTIQNDLPNTIKIFLYSLEPIEKHHEITIAVDRSKEFFIKYPMRGVKHHWQKYDYSSSLICQCDLIKEDQKGLESLGDISRAQELCTIRQIKEVLHTFRTGGKKFISETKESSPPRITEEASGTNSDDSNNQPTHSETSHHGLSREEKKINYWLRVIDEMEHDKKTPKSTKRGRKPLKNQTYNKDEYEPQKSFIGTESLNQSNHHFGHKIDVGKFENDSHTNNANISIDKKSNNHNWYISSKISDVLINNKAIISDLSNSISEKNLRNHRRTQIPIKLALRRGLYHLIPPNINSSITTSKIVNNCNDYPKNSYESLKRSLSEREMDIPNKEFTELSVGKNISPSELPKPKIKKELPPIPELRPTLFPPSKNIPPSGFPSNGLEK